MPILKHTIAINNYFDFFSTSSGIEVEAGTRTHVDVTPVQHLATDGFKELGVDKRGCKHMDENDAGLLFNYYTHKSCMFECRLKKTIDKLKCTAWELPHSKDWEGIALCTADYLDEFNYLMTTKAMSSDCECLPDCEEVTFDTKITIQSLHSGKDIVILV